MVKCCCYPTFFVKSPSSRSTHPIGYGFLLTINWISERFLNIGMWGPMFLSFGASCCIGYFCSGLLFGGIFSQYIGVSGTVMAFMMAALNSSSAFLPHYLFHTCTTGDSAMYTYVYRVSLLFALLFVFSFSLKKYVNVNFRFKLPSRKPFGHTTQYLCVDGKKHSVFSHLWVPNMSCSKGRKWWSLFFEDESWCHYYSVKILSKQFCSA